MMTYAQRTAADSHIFVHSDKNFSMVRALLFSLHGYDQNHINVNTALLQSTTFDILYIMRKKGLC